MKTKARKKLGSLNRRQLWCSCCTKDSPHTPIHHDVGKWKKHALQFDVPPQLEAFQMLDTRCTTALPRFALKGDQARTMITGPTIVNWGAAKYSSIELDSLSSCQKVKQLSFKRCLQLPPSIVCCLSFCALLLERAVYVLVFLSLFLNVCHELWLLLPLDNAHLQHLSACLPARLPHVP